MKTATKNHFSDEQIKQVIKHHFPDEDVKNILLHKGGTFNTIYEIVGSGKLKNSVILKTGPCIDTELPEHEKNILYNEVCAYRLLESKEIPIPKIYVCDFSKSIIPCDYFIMEKIDGISWYEKFPLKEPQLMQSLGKYTAVMHSVETDYFGYISRGEKYRFSKWGDAFSFMVNEALDDIKKQGLTFQYKKIKQSVRKRKKSLDMVKNPCFVNFDMWAGNVLIKNKKNYYISGIIDFERCFMGDPLASFSTALLLYENVEKEKDFLNGYYSVSRKKFRFTKDERERMMLYEMLMYIYSYSETHRYGFLMRTGQRIGIYFIIMYFLLKLR